MSILTGDASNIDKSFKDEDFADDYFDVTPTKQIIADIKAYINKPDENRVKIATAAMNGFYNSGWGANSGDFDEVAKRSLKAADALIKALNKPINETLY